MAWAAAQHKHDSLPVLRLVAQAVPHVLQRPDLSPHTVAGITRAMATARVKDLTALSVIVAWSLPRLSQFSLTALTDLLWGLAYLHHRNDSLLRGLRQVWPKHLRRFDADAAALQRGMRISLVSPLANVTRCYITCQNSSVRICCRSVDQKHVVCGLSCR